MKAVKLISQSTGSRCCGQCCVAMAAGTDLGRAKKAVGTDGCTSTKVLQIGLKKLGVRSRGGRLKAIYGDLAKLPETCILKVVSPWRRSGWHWVFKSKKKIYCPSRGLFMVADYEIEADSKITSYLEIFTDPGRYGTYEQQIGRALRPGPPNANIKTPKNATLYMQQVGRATRSKEGKKKPIIFDFIETHEGERRFIVSPNAVKVKVLNELEQGTWPTLIRDLKGDMIWKCIQNALIAGESVISTMLLFIKASP